MWPPRKKTCTSRKRLPMMRLLRKSLRSSPGRASVTTSKSLGLLPQEQIPDPAPHQIGGIAGMQQAIEDLQGLQFDVFPGDGVFRPGDDVGLGDRWFGRVKPH